MDNINQPVELFFPGQNASLIGSVIEGRPDGVSVQILPPAPASEHVPAGLSAYVSFPSGAMVLQTPARVISFADCVMALQYVGPGRMIQRRQEERYPCSLAVAYRAMRSGMAHGAWKNAETEDISAGGMGVIIPGHIQFPPIVELHVAIPGPAACVDPSRPHGMDDCLFRGTSETTSLVRFTGTARHGKFRPDGSTFVGIKFTAVQPVARLRLMRYLQNAVGLIPEEFEAAA